MRGAAKALYAHLFVGVAPEGLQMERVGSFHGRVDDLIVEGLYQVIHTAFTPMATHYDNVNFTAIGSGYARN